MIRWLSVLLLVAGTAGVAAPATAESWVAPRAVTHLELRDEVLAALGIRVLGVSGVVDDAGFPGFAFETVPPTGLVFRAPGGDFERFDTGELVHAGGPILALPAEPVPLSLEGFRLDVAPAPDDFDLLDAAGVRHFVLRHMQFTSSLARQQLELRNVSIHLAPELARRLGRPDLAGTWVGTANIVLPALLSSDTSGAGAGGTCPETPGEIDVALTGIDYLSQVAREPGVRVAIAPSATLANVGEGSLDWYESIEPSRFDGVGPHPYLSIAFYRLDPDGRLVQLGLGDVKHAFRALNLDCPCPSAPILYAGCADVYGVSTNQDRRYLAPRDEVDPRTGAWQRIGSHFDRCLALEEPACDPATDDADDYRDHGGDLPLGFYHDAFEHRLVVPEAALSAPGARWFIEAWYVAAGDVDLENSIGYREVVPSFAGGAWGFTFPDGDEGGGLVAGSVVGELPGAVAGNGYWIAGEARDLGEGWWRYVYAVANHLRGPWAGLSVPLPPGVEVRNADSRGLGDDPALDWQVQVGDDSIAWAAPPGGDLQWGRLVGFSFEADVAPGPGRVALVPTETGGARTPLLPAVPVPEPGRLVLALSALAALALVRRYGASTPPHGAPL